MLYNAMSMSTESFMSIAENLHNLKYLKIQKLTVPSEAYIILFKIGHKTLGNLTILNFSGKFDVIIGFIFYN